MSVKQMEKNGHPANIMIYTSNQYWRGHLGDGTKEFGPFYRITYQKTSGGFGPTRDIGSYNADTAYFVSNVKPWFIRGESFMRGAGAGLSAFNVSEGSAIEFDGFRIVLTP